MINPGSISRFPQPKIKTIFILVSFSIYALSLFLPCYFHGITVFNEYKAERLKGWECLASGIFLVDSLKSGYNPFPFLSWVSNLPFLIGLLVALVSRRRKGFKAAFIFSVTAFLMALGALLHYEKEGNDIYPLWGSAVWMLSYLMLLVGSRVLLKRSAMEGK